MLLLTVPSTLIGGLLLVRGSMLIKNDLSLVVAELREELDEHRRQQADPDDDPGAPGQQHRLLLRPRAGALRRRLRGAQGRGAGPARHQRRRQVDDPAGDRRPRHPVAWRRAPQRAERSPTSSPEKRGGMGIRLLPGGKGVFPQMTVRENLEMARLRLPQRRGGPGAPDRQGARPVRRPRRPAGPERGVAVGRAAADARPRRARCCTTPTSCSSTSCRSGCRRSWSRSCSASSSG